LTSVAISAETAFYQLIRTFARARHAALGAFQIWIVCFGHLLEASPTKAAACGYSLCRQAKSASFTFFGGVWRQFVPTLFAQTHVERRRPPLYASFSALAARGTYGKHDVQRC